MGDIQTRPFSKNYSGLINQTVIALSITVLCFTGQELMKRKRRGKSIGEGLGSRESWEFGYLYQGRSWARHPSPPTHAGWPLSWIRRTVAFPETKMNDLRGIDATLYIRFLRGCFWYTLLHTVTTFPILFPIHVKFSEDTISPKSMTRASISSLVGTSTGLSLLWIHICLLFWITLSWIVILLWVCHGAFRLRAANIATASGRLETSGQEKSLYHPHPHPQYGFADLPELNHDHSTEGLRLRTIMVSNVPLELRSEAKLKEYFEFNLSRKLEKPSIGLTSSTQPGFLNKSFSFLFNRAKRIPAHLPNPLAHLSSQAIGTADGTGKENTPTTSSNAHETPIIDRVVIARKMTELASLLARREEVLRLLETAHIKLAQKTLYSVKDAMDRICDNQPVSYCSSRAAEILRQRRSMTADLERGDAPVVALGEEERMRHLIETLGPYVEDFGLQTSFSLRSRKRLSRLSRNASRKVGRKVAPDSDITRVSDVVPTGDYPPCSPIDKDLCQEKTIWETLLTLPRSSLDAYQPLVNLSHLFRGKTVPSIDYYTAKLNLLTSLITENRAKAEADFDPVSTAFVTFTHPADARRACKYLAVHPKNYLACLVTMAPIFEDLDWNRVMKSSFKAEFVKDWVVDIGVWAFTLFWLFPVSLLVGLVSIQNISLFWPSLKAYLDRHAWEEEVIQSFLPTLLVALLALLIPLILLLIAKKAHTITTLSALHDKIMTRYYKFLVVNVLVFFCVGTAGLQSFLLSFRSTTRPDVLKVIADSFPTAGPFYVGWLIFTTAIHGAFEIALFGLPLIMYPSTSRQITPRKRAVGVRPRTFNFYYWLPNHLLVIHVIFVFSVLNPFVLPFGALYFFFTSGIVKHQLIHVYAKQYEGHGHSILIRIVRYSLDGLVLSQAVFLAYMVVLKKSVNVGLAAFLIVLTSIVKLLITRMCRFQFEQDDIAEAEIICNRLRKADLEPATVPGDDDEEARTGLITASPSYSSKLSWKLPAWISFSYPTAQYQPRSRRRHTSGLGSQSQSFCTTESAEDDLSKYNKSPTVPSSHKLPVPSNINPKLSGCVTPHPAPVPWDDQTPIDLPYDNPFYTRAISNVLWLPRNPCGIVNLDDTVDFKTSLTVEPTAGQLGTWLGIAEDTSPISMSSNSLTPEPLRRFPTAISSIYDGTEEISLPVAIAKRVMANEGGVEQTLRPRRPSMYHRKLSGSDKSTMGRRHRQPSLLSALLPVSSRAFSESNIDSRTRSMSVVSTLESPPADLSQSAIGEPGSHRHALRESTVATGSNSLISLAPPRLTRAQNVSTHHAIVHEVLAEEEHALANRREEEQAEANKAKTTKSWLTSWMFKKSE